MLWRQFSTTFLRSAARQRIPVTHVVKVLRREGISFRYKEMLDVYRAELPRAEAIARYKYIPNRYRIPKTLMEKARWKIRDNYQYETYWQMRDKQTGQEYLSPHRALSSTNLSYDRLYEQERDIMRERGESLVAEVGEMYITRVLIR